MSDNQHPAVSAREQRLHRIRVRIATAAVGLFVALFSVIYSETQSSASVTPAPTDAPAPSDQPMPMTSGQS
jgi:hypothetical protein